YTSLRKCIAAYCGTDHENVIVGNGSTELISLFIQIEHPKKAMIIGPTYSEYEREISLGGGTTLYYPLREKDDFRLDVNDFISHLNENIDLLVICNPNNPTSSCITSADMRHILDACKEYDIYVMVDETYVEFAENMEEIDSVPLTNYYNNIVILRGTSKFFAAPGLRLGYAITGNPAYSVTGGSIIFNGEDITELPVNERAKKGIFLSFQNPLEVPGVTLSAFIRSALEQKTGDRLRLWDFKKKFKETMALLNMDESYAERDLNVGFSGGEKKKAEILQMLMLEPKLAILDETDSGLDVDAVRTVSEGVRLFRERTHGSLLIITHSTRILEALHVDAAHVMEDGVIVRNGGAELVDEINEKGFGSLKED
ncbi:Fe-S cluster assembly ATPase SufC, partial [bacterium]|nr:Fe-S cluster assembly ATPase SufC [bacterium]